MKAAASSGMMPEGTNISPDMLKVRPPLRCSAVRTASSIQGCLTCRNLLDRTDGCENWFIAAICSAVFGLESPALDGGSSPRLTHLACSPRQR